ncbi:hypothetical protein [Streptomyces sp. NPDC090022]|uniref:hypothetical protein n=1 Tax=Streptomyces sp. NPDC090022 TaxID=3365920 RepID=UPI003803BFC8
MSEGKGLVIAAAITTVGAILAAVVTASCAGSKGEPSIDQRGGTNVVCGDNSHCANR